ncbi:MAG TPA: type II toxin-antitoxin system YafQ family toxin [Terriglobales bacterium]
MNKPLPERNRDHALGADWRDHRERHLKPDLLLLYSKPDADVLQLVRLGSHSELFGRRPDAPSLRVLCARVGFHKSVPRGTCRTRSRVAQRFTAAISGSFSGDGFSPLTVTLPNHPNQARLALSPLPGLR